MSIAKGYSCHFGLGQFVAVDGQGGAQEYVVSNVVKCGVKREMMRTIQMID